METLDPYRLYTPAEVSAITGLSETFIRSYARGKHPHARGGRRAIRFRAEHIRLLLQHVEAGGPVPPLTDVSHGRDIDPPAWTPNLPSAEADWLALRSCAADLA